MSRLHQETTVKKPQSVEYIRSVRTKAANRLIAVIGDEDICVGFLITGIGNIDIRTGHKNFMIVTKDTTVKEIQECFLEYLERADIAIILICQNVADQIRNIVDAYDKAIPAVLEIPSRGHPYNSDHDYIIKRAKKLGAFIEDT